jgi:hypothetical protein
LMVTMLVRKACISSLSSKISSYQGVLFQSISCRDNLGLIREELGTCAPDVPGSRCLVNLSLVIDQVVGS